MIHLESWLSEDDSAEAGELRHIFDIPYTGENGSRRMPRFIAVPFKPDADA